MTSGRRVEGGCKRAYTAPDRAPEPVLATAGADCGQTVNLLVMPGAAVTVVANGDGTLVSVVAGSVWLIADASAAGRVASLADAGTAVSGSAESRSLPGREVR
jgi:hypothetical protein